MGWLTWTFLGLLALNLALKEWLDYRQKRSVLMHRNTVPVAFKDRVSLAEHQKAAGYTVATLNATRWGRLRSYALLLVWTIGGGIGFLDQVWREVFQQPILLGTAVVASLFVIEWAIDVPVKYRSTFGLEQRFGFNRSTRKTFVIDRFIALLLTVFITVLLVVPALYLMRLSYWWLHLSGFWIVLIVFLAWVAPRYVTSLFNKLKPLEEGSLRSRLAALCERCGFNLKHVFVMDGSRRSTKMSAFFGGLGRNKRIVFYDTLLAQMSEEEVEAVLAHELGHCKLRHNLKSLVFLVVVGLGCTALLGWVHGETWFYVHLGVIRSSDHAAVLLFVLVSPVFLVFLKPLSSLMSRRREFEADAFAATHSDAQKLSEGLVKLANENAVTLTPDPLYSGFHYRHPPVPERIARLQETVGS